MLSETSDNPLSPEVSTFLRPVLFSKRLRCANFLLWLSCFLSPVGTEAAPRYRAIKDCVEQSTFAFIGTVTTPASSTMPIHITPSDSTFTVSVDDTIIVPRRLRDHLGQQIMLVSDGPAHVTQGERFYFLVTGFFHGTNMAAREFCRFAVDPDSLLIRDYINQARTELANEKIKDRLKAAEVVVVGRIAGISPFTRGTPQQSIASEHNPDWWEAQVEVLSTEKGRARSSLTALFAHSADPAWVLAPKLVASRDSLILILDKTHIREFDVDSLTVINPLDVQPSSELRRIRQLLAEVRIR